MRALTVRQPWAAAIVLAGKDVENRTWATSHRGLLAVHAGKVLPREVTSDLVADIHNVTGVRLRPLATGAIIGVVDLVDCHRATDCAGEAGLCSQWAEDGASAWHWVLEAPRPVDPAVPATGALRLWRPSAPAIAAVTARLQGGAA